MRQLQKRVSEQSLNQARSFDELLSALGGGGGRYQILVLVFMTLCLSVYGSAALAQTFARLPMNFTCRVNGTRPGCVATVSEDQCIITQRCAAGDVRMFRCSSWSFGANFAGGVRWRRSIVSQFGLVCDSARMALLPELLFLFGVCAGSCPYGLLADLLGRHSAVVASLLNVGAASLVSALAPNYWTYAVAQLLCGLGAGGLLVCGFVSLAEATDGKHRHYWTFAGRLGASAGVLVTLALAAALRDYRHVLLGVCVVSVSYNLPVAYLGRSPRWLAASGRTTAAEAAVRRVARVNSVALPADYRLGRQLCRGERATTLDPRRLLSRRPLAKATSLTIVTWLSAAVPFHGVALLGSSWPADTFAASLLWLGPDVAACLLGLLAGRALGRRGLLMLAFGLSLLLLLGAAGVRLLQQPALIVGGVALVTKMSLSLTLDAVWLSSCELCPTWLRASGVGLGAAVSAVCGLAAAVLLEPSWWWAPLPFLVFSAFSAAGLVCSFFADETRHRTLVDLQELHECDDSLTVSSCQPQELHTLPPAENGTLQQHLQQLQLQRTLL